MKDSIKEMTSAGISASAPENGLKVITMVDTGAIDDLKKLPEGIESDFDCMCVDYED